MTASSPLASRVRLSLFLGTLSAALLASALVIVQGVNLDRTEAVVDALAEFGVTHIDMPASPERVWQAIRAARSQALTPTAER